MKYVALYKTSKILLNNHSKTYILTSHNPYVKSNFLNYNTTMAELKLFPIDIQDFARLRRDGKYYVDKTDINRVLSFSFAKIKPSVIQNENHPYYHEL